MTKKRKSSEGRPLKYLTQSESTLRTFQIRYEKKLSSIAKLVLNSFQNKYIYYAIDDILDSFQSNPNERDNLLAILYSPILSLQNNFSIHFLIFGSMKFTLKKYQKLINFLRMILSIVSNLVR